MPFKEKCKVIPNYTRYEVSNLGAIRNRKTKNIKMQRVMKSTGYVTVNLYPDGKSQHDVVLVHRIVAISFLPNDNHLPCINHIDENKQNNYVNNLEWVTYEQNNNYGTRNKRISKRNKGNHKGLLKAIKIVAIDKNGNKTHFKSVTECAEKLGLYRSSISLVLHGKMRTTGGYRFEVNYNAWMNIQTTI